MSPIAAGVPEVVVKYHWGGTARWLHDVNRMFGKTREEAHGVKSEMTKTDSVDAHPDHA